MHSPPDLNLKVRLKLVRQSIFAALRFRGHRPIRITAGPHGALIHIDGIVIHTPSALRWKLYKKGWSARLDQLECEYGVGKHVMLTPKSVVLDVGANAGEFAHVAARYGARTYCIEPDERAFACLGANTTELANVSIYNSLFWRAEEEISFFSAPHLADSSVFNEGQGPETKRFAITAQRFCSDNNIEKIDLLKCDAEGAEPEVLEGMGAMLRRTSVVALDTGAERMGERTDAACEKILCAAGFRIISEKHGTRCMTYGVRK